MPLIVVSPWTRGGWVNSQVHDHTSVIRFLEQRFGVHEPNIMPWRRAVTGDMTSMFDFADPDGSALRAFPPTDDYLAKIMAQAKLPKPEVPEEQSVPGQEPGRRPVRALPYRMGIEDRVRAKGLELSFANRGEAGLVYNVYAPGSEAGPWFYTVEAGKRVRDRLPGMAASGAYAVSAFGPNGFLREFAGDMDAEAKGGPVVRVEELRDGGLLLKLANHGASPVTLSVAAPTYGEVGDSEVRLGAGEARSLRIDTAKSDRWYDLIVRVGEGGFRRRFAGYVETGAPGMSDPALDGRARA